MIFGIGVDIVEVRRLERWVRGGDLTVRFFAPEEQSQASSFAARCRHYAVRFAAKEAFSKALGTGLCGFSLKDVFIVNDAGGRPELHLRGAAEAAVKNRCGKCRIHVSLSHEQEYAAAFVVIEGIGRREGGMQRSGNGF
ncbi:MAG: holo-ACP synthase [Treponemataceae bacterium]|nr:holo-ACP synthase [Treponemataceae bacterium]